MHPLCASTPIQIMPFPSALVFGGDPDRPSLLGPTAVASSYQVRPKHRDGTTYRLQGSQGATGLLSQLHSLSLRMPVSRLVQALREQGVISPEGRRSRACG